MHASGYRLSLAAVYLEVNFQPALVPLSLQLPPNPPGSLNLFSVPYGLGSDGNGLRIHWGVLVESYCTTADSTLPCRNGMEIRALIQVLAHVVHIGSFEIEMAH